MKNFEIVFTRYISGLSIVTMLLAIGMYLYLGNFSRYLADDYCEAVQVKNSNPIGAVMDRYSAGAIRASNRYSNLFFVGVSELLGNNSMQITIISMTLLWVVGLCWCVHETRRFLKMDWSPYLDVYWGMTLGFFSFLQAPNLFQTVYWRSSMMTHFAPLVFGSFLFAFLARRLRQLRNEPPSRSVYAFAFFFAFITAGFSEPPATTLVVVLPLLLIAIWLWEKNPVKQKQLALLTWAFAGAFLGLMTMIFSPAGANVAQARSLDLVVILGTSLKYSYLFIVDALKIAPLPNFLSMLIPLMLIWLHHQSEPSLTSPNKRNVALLAIMVIPFLMWLLIAAGFAPSVYGQSFPVERMRFLARVIMISAFMVEGALLGFLLKDLGFRRNQVMGQWVVLALFTIVAVVYPLRAALNILRFTVPEYRAHAERWDVRDAQIRSMVELGVTDAVVIQIDTMYGVNEYKGDPTHWINRCAAQYYGLNSLIAP